MLERAQQGRAIVVERNFFSDHVSDPLVEAFAHRAGGVQIWSAMKWSAQQSASPNVLGGDGRAANATPGGAWYVASRLAAFCKAHPDEVEVHAAGHSAGAIFHAHFIPCALAQGVPQFHSLHLMAPAVRVDLFRQQLQERVGKGKGIEKLAMYTMQDGYEKNDNCGTVYRKSLLYLIYHALEPEVDQPILGLERCVRADAALKRLFGIGIGSGQPAADVIWSDTGIRQGRSASCSHTHGGFDDDPATMGSIVRRVLGKADADRIVELPAARRAIDPWSVPVDYWAQVLAEHDLETWTVPQQQPPSRPQPAAGWQPPVTGFAIAPPQRMQTGGSGANGANGAEGGGRRIALCVGIDSYPTAPLGGCVNDARAWSDAFVRLGFDTPRTLFNQQATRDAIMTNLMALVGDSRPGDVIVFQYAGHGTQVPDLDGDELGGDTPGEDEALCPYDFASGELLIDDDMRAVFRRLPDGVNLTCFFDCCHSGTITRFAIGGRPGVYAHGKRARFILADSTLIANFVARRSAMSTRREPGGSLETMREVVFSACLSSEVALESQGHGDFTRCAMQVLAQDVSGLSNGDFADRVTQAFGQSPQQHAKLYCSDEGRALGLLRPLRAPERGRALPPNWMSAYDRARVAENRMHASALHNGG
jgi:hypothetical protein